MRNFLLFLCALIPFAAVGQQKINGNLIVNGSTPLTKLAPENALTIPCNNTNGALTPFACSVSQINAMLVGGGAGTVTTTGSPTSGNLTKFSGANSITNAVSGTDYLSPVGDASATYVIATGSTTERTLADRFANCADGSNFGMSPANAASVNDVMLDLALSAISTTTSVFCITVDGVYQLAESHSIPDPTTRISLSYGVTLSQNGNANIFTKSGSLGGLIGSGVTGTVPLGSVTLTMPSTTGLSVDDWVFIKSNDQNPLVTTGLQVGMLRKVTALGAQMHIDAATNQTMTTSIQVRKATLCQRTDFDGGTYTATVQATQTAALLYFHLCNSPNINNINIVNSGGPGVDFDWSVGGNVDKITISNLLDNLPAGNAGYGILASGATRGLNINSGNISKVRHGFTTATGFPDGSQTDTRGEPEAITVGYGYYCYDSTNACIDTHEAGYGIYVTPHVQGSFDGVEIRSSNQFVTGGEIVGVRRNCIKISPPASNPQTVSTLVARIKDTVCLNVANDGSGSTCVSVQQSGMQVYLDNMSCIGYTTTGVSTVAGSQVFIKGGVFDGQTVGSQTGFDFESSGNTVDGATVANNFVGINEGAGLTGNSWVRMTYSGNTSNLVRIPTYTIVDPTVSPLPVLPSSTFASLPAPASATGSLYTVTDCNNAIFVSDGTHWNPLGGSFILAKGSGSLAAPINTISGTASTTNFTIPGGSPKIPAGVMRAGSQVHTEAIVRKNGANATFNLATLMGTLNSVSDNNVYGLSAIANVDNRQTWAFADASVATTTTFYRPDGSIILTPSSSATASGSDASTNFNTASDNFFNVRVSGQNASDSFDLIEYKVVVIP